MGSCRRVPGKLFIEMSTLQPMTVARWRRVATPGARLIDSPVLGSIPTVREGKLVALVGGAAADVARARGVLDHLTRRVEPIGPIGAGCAMKLAVNLGMAVQLQALAESLALGLSEGLTLDQMLDVMSDAVIATPWFKGKLPVLKGEPGDITLDVRTLRKDMMSAIATGACNGVAMPATSGALASLAAAVAGGWGDKGSRRRCRSSSARTCCRITSDRSRSNRPPRRAGRRRRALRSSVAAKPCQGGHGTAQGRRAALGARPNPGSLDPVTGRTAAEFTFLQIVHDALLDFDPVTLDPKPGLAKAYAFEDPTTFTMDLVENASFHDGTPFDAEAVKFNLDRARTDRRSNVKADIATIRAIEVAGKYRVILRLERPNAALPAILTDRPGMMVSPTNIKQNGANADQSPVGTGPVEA